MPSADAREASLFWVGWRVGAARSILRRIGRVNRKHPMVGRKPLDEMRKASDGMRSTIRRFVAKHRECVGSIAIEKGVNR